MSRLPNSHNASAQSNYWARKTGSHGQAPTPRFRKNSSQLGRPQDTSYHLYDIHADK